MNWIITGGCGFIGASLVKSLLKNGHNVRVIDNFSVGTLSDLGSAVSIDVSQVAEVPNWEVPLQVFHVDIRISASTDNLFNGGDVCVHLAANTGVPASVADPHGDCLANVQGTLNVLEACRHQNVRRLIFASSSAPLGQQIPPLREDMAPRPESPYGASKLAGEGYCSAYNSCFGVETVVLRFGNVYGPGSANKTSIVAKFIKKAIRDEPFKIYGTGLQTRDFIYIEDLVRAIFLAGLRERIGGEIFQIAANNEVTVSELIGLMVKVLLSRKINFQKIEHTDVRTGDIYRNYSDISNAQNLLEWSPSVNLEDGLAMTVDYFLQHKEGLHH